MLKKLLTAALLCLSLLWLTAGVAEHRGDDVVTLARWAGCNATVYTSDAMPSFDSFYMPGEHALYIGTSSDAPAWVDQMIVLHEIGHCLQAELGYLFSLHREKGIVAVELDADRWAAQLACGLGLDGRTLLHDLFVWAKQNFDYDGDDSHGTLEQRIRAAERADYCRPVLTQA